MHILHAVGNILAEPRILLELKISQVHLLFDTHTFFVHREEIISSLHNKTTYKCLFIK